MWGGGGYGVVTCPAPRTFSRQTGNETYWSRVARGSIGGMAEPLFAATMDGRHGVVLHLFVLQGGRHEVGLCRPD
jgi:hypothetical protein